MFFNCASVVSAQELFVQNSAKIQTFNTNLEDHRIAKLESFLSKYKSPLSKYASHFIYYADLYEIDWRLLPAISGVESTFGKRIPQGSFNAYGWNGGNYKFKSWEDSIESMSKNLREKYYDKNLKSIWEIGRVYCPPNPQWPYKVSFFINRIDPTGVEFSL